MAFKKLKYWFDTNLADFLSEKILKVYPDFDNKIFCKNVTKKIEPLELKDRVEVFCDELHFCLKGDYKNNIKILIKILGPENDKETGMFKEFYWIMPIAKYVEKYGANDFEISLKAIEEITKRNTGEYAIRPYLEIYPEETLKRMLKWSTNKNKHIRRLASEGVRPRLPWAKKMQQFIDCPEKIIPILENLKNDASKYVQNSVANCLNDILKDNETIGREVIKNWIQKPTKQRKWIVMHAIRNFRKKEIAWAMEVKKELEN